MIPGSMPTHLRRHRLVSAIRVLIPCLVLTGGFLNTTIAADYFISPHGYDTNTGVDAAHPWRSIDRTNRIQLQPGDRILFLGGSQFEGSIRLDNSDHGDEKNGITLSSYGEGSAVIYGGDKEALVADGCVYLTIQNLEFAGSGRKTGNTRSGVVFRNGRFIRVENCQVSGFQKSGIEIESCSDVHISKVHATENGLSGIYVHSNAKDQKNIVITGCTAVNNPGDPTNLSNHSGNGILVSGIDGGLVEYCMATNNGWDMPREGNGPVGIWAYFCNNIVIQHCISHHNKTSPKGKDGGGFDFDGGVTHSILQYNYSYENEGAGYGLYQYYGADFWRNNIIRYNISVNDGWKNGQCGIHVWSDKNNVGTMSDADIYNNTIINEFGHGVAYLTDVPGLSFRNNIFVAGKAQIEGPYHQSRYENNCYWSLGKNGFAVENCTGISDWSKKTGQEKKGEDILGFYADPLLSVGIPIAEPVTDPKRLNLLTVYRLTQNSPCRNSGLLIMDNGGRDFWGNPLPEVEGEINVGAHQF